MHPSFAPLFAAGPIIAAHAFAAMTALAIGIVQLVGRKGTHPHRIMGYIWATLMMLIAGSSLWIHDLRMFGIWSPIHILSLFTLGAVPVVVWFAHRHNIRRHRRGMILLFWLALVGAGLFTFLPGRDMNKVLFGDTAPA